MNEGRVTITLRVGPKLANKIREYAELRELTTNAALVEMIEMVLDARQQTGNRE